MLWLPHDNSNKRKYLLHPYCEHTYNYIGFTSSQLIISSHPHDNPIMLGVYYYCLHFSMRKLKLRKVKQFAQEHPFLLLASLNCLPILQKFNKWKKNIDYNHSKSETKIHIVFCPVYSPWFTLFGFLPSILPHYDQLHPFYCQNVLCVNVLTRMADLYGYETWHLNNINGHNGEHINWRHPMSLQCSVFHSICKHTHPWESGMHQVEFGKEAVPERGKFKWKHPSVLLPEC